MTLVVKDRGASWMAWAAAALGIIAIAGEAFVAAATLLSGFLFGLYDVAGVGLGIAAVALVWKRPVSASVLWLAEEAMLYNGHLLVSVAFLPLLLFPLASAALAGWSWLRSRTGRP